MQLPALTPRPALPKTILSSCQTCQWIVGSGAVALGGTALATTHLTFATGIAAVAVLAILAIQAAVIAIGWKDPSKLMLTEMTGAEYTQHQQTMTSGDSISGEKLEPLNMLGAAQVGEKTGEAA